MQKKYLLPHLFIQLRLYKRSKETTYMKKAIFGLKQRFDKTYREFYYEKIAYKTLFALKRLKRLNARKKECSAKANWFSYSQSLKKVLQGLGHKVEQHRLLKKDLVKRYWVHNQKEENEKEFEEEFFPVTICSKRKLMRLDDQMRNYMYDVVEPDPHFFVLNNRS